MENGKYYRKSRSNTEDDYSNYLNMHIGIQSVDYDQYKFESVFQARYFESDRWLEGNKIFFFYELDNILPYATNVKDYLNWNELLRIKKFEAPKPKIKGLLPKPLQPQRPIEPEFDGHVSLQLPPKPIYKKRNIKLKNPILLKILNIFFHITNQAIFGLKWLIWKKGVQQINDNRCQSQKYQKYRKLLDKYSIDLNHFHKAIVEWNNQQQEFTNKLNESILIWGKAKESYKKLARDEYERLIKIKNSNENNKHGIEELVTMALYLSPYPNLFPREFEVNYDTESKIVVVEYKLPDFDRIDIVDPLKNYKEKSVSKTKKKKLVQSTLFSIAIRSLYEIVEITKQAEISSVVFNGWVNFIDKANGKERNEYILTVHAPVNKIEELVVDKIEAEACFKSLKGIAAKKVFEYIPVAPILTINKNDNRIIEGREVIEGLSIEENLAAMDWDDFEHLIRELFEREFAKHGAEVRVTRSSHDRGVDAIVYDPDPLRGGKFIIQAKRYTNVVNVSAVRDLYGAIQNENANRGILVTTSHYGTDAYEFAKDKNITLLTGEHLLHLLEKHGYRFRIDIKEARKILNLK